MIFTPAGGMNQDDSIVTPSKNTAGRSLFGLGDYRYALNMRNKFGDAENLKGTQEVESYYRKGQVFTNPNFETIITPWAQIVGPGGTDAWVLDPGGGVRIVDSTPSAFVSHVIYQPVSVIPGQTGTLVFNVAVANGSITNYVLEIVFLNGTTILSSEIIQNGTVVEFDSKTVTIPATCNAIGFRASGTGDASSGNFEFEIFSAKFNTWGLASAPAGTELVKGRLEDKEFLKVYYLVQNSNGNDTLRVYDYATDSIYELLQWDGLKLDAFEYIKLAKIDEWLAFTGRNTQKISPRLVNVDTITDLKLDLGTDFREFHIAFHKWAPTVPPIPRVYYDSVTNNYAKLKNKTYQFSQRYVYIGNLKTRWSPISKAAALPGKTGSFYAARTITSIELDISGAILDVPGADVQYNYFSHDSNKFCKAVAYIEVAFRDSELGIWQLWKRIEKNDDGVFDRLHYFNGDFDGRPVDTNDFTQPFDTVPIYAGTVEAIDNRFMFGDCLDENEPASFRVEEVSTVTDPAIDWNDSDTGSFSQFSGNPSLREKLQRLNALSEFNMKARAKYKLAIQYGSHTGWRSLGYTTDNFVFEVSDVDQARLNAFKFNIPMDIKPPDWATWYQILRTNAIGIDYFMIGSANTFTPVLDKASTLIGLTNLSQELKDRLAQHFENSSIVNGYEVNDEINKVKKGTSDLLSPVEAYLMKTGRSPFDPPILKNNQLQNYIRTNPLFNKIGPEVRDSQTESVVDNASRIYIDINNWYNAAQETGTKNRIQSKLYYNYRKGDGIRKGDRVRFYASNHLHPADSSEIQVYDEEIIEFTGSGIIVNKPQGILSLPNDGVDAAVWVTHYDIEVYTPKIAESKDYVFYETGEWYPVLYPGTSKRDFAKRDWRYTSNADVTVDSYGPFDVFKKMPFSYGDCFSISKSSYRDNNAIAVGIGVSMNPDPDRTYDHWERNNGRPAVTYYDLPVSKFKPTQVRFGGQIVEESFLNSINRFRDRDQFIYPSEYGRIRDLVNTANAQVESVGSILLAIGEREAWSIYVNRQTFEDLGGRTQVSLSDRVLGSYNTLLGSQGTLNPESVSKENGRVWWWNALSGAWVRYGRDGLTEISGYKMRTWFREISELLIDKYSSNELPRVISEYDVFNEELITRIDHSSLPELFRVYYQHYKGCVFSEEDTRWKACHNHYGEFFSKVATVVLNFREGRLFKLERDEDNHNTFYGTKYDMMIEPVFNDDMASNKLIEAIGVFSTDKWSVEQVLGEYRGLKDKQKSIIPLDVFTEKEDIYWAPFKRDINSNGGVINGLAMRGKAFQVLLKLDPSVIHKSLLHYVSVGSVDSPKGPA